MPNSRLIPFPASAAALSGLWLHAHSGRRLAGGRRSKTRAVVEHVFARQKAQMKPFIRIIGVARATAKIGMANLVYNLSRYIWHPDRVAPA